MMDQNSNINILSGKGFKKNSQTPTEVKPSSQERGHGGSSKVNFKHHHMKRH